jgi:hypothetical protein
MGPPHFPRPPPPWLWNATVITFDDVPDGTVIDTHYQSKGVTFAMVTNSKHRPPIWHSASAYARQTPNAESRPNVVSAVQTGGAAFDARSGGVQAKFAAPQLYVSIDAQAVPVPELLTAATNKPFIQAFDALGNVLYTTFYPPNYGDSGYGSWQPLIVSSSSANIARVVFSCQHLNEPDVFGLFDRLVFAESLPPIRLGP